MFQLCIVRATLETLNHQHSLAMYNCTAYLLPYYSQGFTLCEIPSLSLLGGSHANISVSEPSLRNAALISIEPTWLLIMPAKHNSKNTASVIWYSQSIEIIHFIPMEISVYDLPRKPNYTLHYTSSIV